MMATVLPHSDVYFDNIPSQVNETHESSGAKNDSHASGSTSPAFLRLCSW